MWRPLIMDISRYLMNGLPEDSDFAELGQLNGAFDIIDLYGMSSPSLSPVTQYPCVGKWIASNVPSLPSSPTISDNTLTWTNTINLTGLGSVSQSGNFFSITSDGLYRITYSLNIQLNSTFLEGYITAG